VHVYRWALPEDIGPLQAALRALVNGQVDVVMFTSSVQFIHAARVAKELDLKSQFLPALKNSVVASIGPTTSETLRSHGINVDFEPSHPKMGFLVKEGAERSADLMRQKSEPRAAIKK